MWVQGMDYDSLLPEKDPHAAEPTAYIGHTLATLRGKRGDPESRRSGMDKFKAWLAAHKITAHTIAAAAVTLTGLYAKDEAFRNYVNGLYGHTPSWVHQLVAGAIIPIFTYYRSQKAN